MNVNRSARIAAKHHSGLEIEKVQRIASAGTDDRQTLKRPLLNGAADITRRTRLNNFGRAGNGHGCRYVTDLKRHIDGRWLIDQGRVSGRNKLFEACFFNR